MAMVTLEALLDGSWHPAATLEFAEEAKGDRGSCSFEYDFTYLTRWLASRRLDVTASELLPLDFAPSLLRRWPSFLDDLRPMGNARRWWLNRLRLEDGPASDVRLLSAGTAAPIGNLRIAQSLPFEGEAPRRFPLGDVVEREHDFISWAAEHGAQVGGATGAGGESPKLLLRRDANDQVWIDVWQDEPENAAAHVLVKFPRAKTERDRLILRSEAVYYRALAKLGIDTVRAELHEGTLGPSLWLDRFDVRREHGREVRLGVESVYSLLGALPGARLRHQEVLAALKKIVPAADWPGLLLEYVKRDVLNLVFGNSDNHGRNTSVLKSANAVWLAPVYDFAPMKMDLEGIARSTTWGEFERGGEIDWPHLLPTFGEHETAVRTALFDLAEQLTGLPNLLASLRLPDETLRHPPLGLMRTSERLSEWGLL